MEAAEGPRHAIFVAPFRGGAVAAEPPGVVDQLAVVLVGVPLRPERVGERGVRLRRQPTQHPAQPDMEEIHEVRVRDGVVVGWVGADQVEFTGLDFDRRLAYRRWQGAPPKLLPCDRS